MAAVNAPARLLAAVTAALAATVVAACSEHDDAGPTGCAATIDEAAVAMEVDEEVGLLDDALLVCPSAAAFQAALGEHPGIVGYDLPTFLALRCSKAGEAVRNAPTCTEVVGATTTAPTTTVAEIVFVGETLDGRLVELRPGAGIEFVDDVPVATRRTVDAFGTSGCDGVYAMRDLWASQVGDPTRGDEASVYAKHADTVARFLGCEPRPLPG